MADVSSDETPGIVERARRSHLWDGVRASADAADALDARTLALLAQLHDAQMDDTDRIVREIRRNRSAFESMPIYGVVGDQPIVRQMPSFITTGEWLLQGLFAWADPAAAANVNLQLSIDSIPIPVALLASKTDITVRSPLGIPVNEHDTLKLALAGTPADRAVLLLVFARLS